MFCTFHFNVKGNDSSGSRFAHAPLPFSKSKFNLKSDRVNLVANPIECLLYLTNVHAIQYKLGPERFIFKCTTSVRDL